MSGATSPRDDLLVNRLVPRALVTAFQNAFGTPVKRVAFWSAVVLPVTYLPLLLGGLNGVEVPMFSGLLAVNALALVIGHGYGD